MQEVLVHGIVGMYIEVGSGCPNKALLLYSLNKPPLSFLCTIRIGFFSPDKNLMIYLSWNLFWFGR